MKSTYKHSEETKLKISNSRKGKNKGIKQSEEWILKRSTNKKRGSHFNCIFCDSLFWRMPSEIIKGENKFCSKSCYQKNQKGKAKDKKTGFSLNPPIGEKNKNWKGGITPKNVSIRNSSEYKKWRISVFERDEYTCQECFIKSSKGVTAYLNAHHIKPFALYEELRFDIDNGMTLCKKCHDKKPKGKQIYEQQS